MVEVTFVAQDQVMEAATKRMRVAETNGSIASNGMRVHAPSALDAKGGMFVASVAKQENSESNTSLQARIAPM